MFRFLYAHSAILPAVLAAALLVTLPLASVAWGGCWDTREKAAMGVEELDGNTILSFKDAVSCEPIANARVEMDGDPFTTDERGYVVFSNASFKGMMDERFPLAAAKEGYIVLRTEILVELELVRVKRFLMSRIISLDKARFVLQWGDEPKDLDLHLVSRDFHVSFRKMKNAAGHATLDRDDLDGSGPETITLQRIERDGKYVVYVHNYSGFPAINEGVRLYVYLQNKLDRIIDVRPTVQLGVEVFVLDKKKGAYPNRELKDIPDLLR